MLQISIYLLVERYPTICCVPHKESYMSFSKTKITVFHAVIHFSSLSLLHDLNTTCASFLLRYRNSLNNANMDIIASIQGNALIFMQH